jgi:hypothetical protein
MPSPQTHAAAEQLEDLRPLPESDVGQAHV